LRVQIRGAVQGVGFRPFVHHLAAELALAGWVSNAASGVLIEVEAPRAVLELFLKRLREERPPACVLQTIEYTWADVVGYSEFEIRESDAKEAKTAWVLPDLATCPECLVEVFNPGDRRFRYPFTNCTRCGPRFTIILSLPYDRARTTMRDFA